MFNINVKITRLIPCNTVNVCKLVAALIEPFFKAMILAALPLPLSSLIAKIRVLILQNGQCQCQKKKANFLKN